MVGVPHFVANSSLAAVLAAIFSGGTFAWVLRYLTVRRGQTLDSEERIRDHYAKEVARLTEKLETETKGFKENIEALEKHWRSLEEYWRRALQEEEARHEECRADRDTLRLRVQALEDELAGIRRQISRYSANRLVIMEDMGKPPPSEKAPEAVKSARRLRDKD